MEHSRTTGTLRFTPVTGDNRTLVEGLSVSPDQSGFIEPVRECLREADGLAKSSRNTYLSPEERQAALVLSRAVFRGQELAASGLRSPRELLDAMTALIQAEPLARIDYVSAVDGVTMMPAQELREGVLVAMAVYIGKTRLIDNFIVGGADA